jgi:hypothetical protein
MSNIIIVKGKLNKATENYTPSDLEITYQMTGVIIDNGTGNIHSIEPVMQHHKSETITSDRLMLIDKYVDDEEIMYEFVIDDSLTDSIHITYDRETKEFNGYREIIRTKQEERKRKIEVIKNN